MSCPRPFSVQVHVLNFDTGTAVQPRATICSSSSAKAILIVYYAQSIFGSMWKTKRLQGAVIAVHIDEPKGLQLALVNYYYTLTPSRTKRKAFNVRNLQFVEDGNESDTNESDTPGQDFQTAHSKLLQ